ncbi:MAG: aminoacyl-tRNA hydrolase [Alphaproteobacteria bacterium]
MRLLVGLGNPGPRYAHNRHNVGYMAIDAIRHHYGFASERSRFQSAVSEGEIKGCKILTLRPLTYMNESGRAVREAMGFYKIEPSEVLVIHDELDLAPGKVRTKQGGSAGGHNGLRSLDSYCGTDYWRLRIGIGHPGVKEAVSAHVLSDFAKIDQEWLPQVINAVVDALPLLLEGETNRFMTRVALLTQSAPSI